MRNIWLIASSSDDSVGSGSLMRFRLTDVMRVSYDRRRLEGSWCVVTKDPLAVDEDVWWATDALVIANGVVFYYDENTTTWTDPDGDTKPDFTLKVD